LDLTKTVPSQGSVAAVLVDVALDAALAFRLGESPAGGVPNAMWITRVKIAVMTVISVSLLGIETGVAARHALAEQPRANRKPPKADSPEPKAVRTDQYGDPLPEGAVARLGTVRFRTIDQTCLAFSPDGTILAAGDTGGYLVFWEAATGKELRRWKGNELAILELTETTTRSQLTDLR
jgi:hypothetical protein